MPNNFTGKIITGVLGYNLKKNFLSEGFFYRETETFNYEIYVKPDDSSATPYKDIQDRILSQYTTAYSGDVNVKVFEIPADYNSVPKDHVRLGQFNVQVERRRTISDLETQMPELGTDYYKGFDSTFIKANCNNINEISESFSLEENENGNQVYAHDLSFNIRTGGRAVAIKMASGIFAGDQDTTFGINAFINGASLTDGSYLNYYTESYDTIRDNYNFSKKREILPANAASYTYDMSHSLVFEENGTLNVTEKVDVFGHSSYEQASQGAGALISNSYSRCNNLYTTFKDNMAGSAVGDPLVNLALTTTKTYNKPNLQSSYEINYTNNPNYDAAKNASVEKIIDLNTDARFVSIQHTYNYTLLISPISGDMDEGYIHFITESNADSPIEISNFYTNSVFYNSNFPNINMISIDANTPNRGRNFSFSFGYTNRPTNFVTINGITYTSLDYKFTDAKPVDIVTEYKIINRPSKTSLINYSYQTQKGAKSLEITARIERTLNTFTNPISNISTHLSNLFKWGIEKLLTSLIGENTFSINYNLSETKYDLNSDNELKLSIVIEYVIKKYTDT